MTHIKRLFCRTVLMGLLAMSLPALAGVVLVAHTGVGKIDLLTAQRIYTGKVIQVAGVSVAPVNLAVGQGARQRFLSDYLQQNDDTYLAYWTVRRYVGKGSPPRDLANAAEVIAYIQSTPGAIAYLDEADVPSSMSIILRK
ncbi:MAG: hypothetical protein Q7U28_04080 [Aquabacterium sp.]|nr:hypothetical protein [Aquabacterium sp.]